MSSARPSALLISDKRCAIVCELRRGGREWAKKWVRMVLRGAKWGCMVTP